MTQQTFYEKNAWFIRVLWFIFWVAVSIGGSYVIYKKLFPFLHVWAVLSFIWWFVTLVAITKIKPEVQEKFGQKAVAYGKRTLLFVVNFILLQLAVLIELIYQRQSFWWGSVSVVLWVMVLFLIARGNHRRNHPKHVAEEFARDLANQPVQNTKVTRELMLELGLPTDSKTTINMADFENALERNSRARIDEAIARKIESIVAALNAHALELSDASQLIQETLGLRTTATTVVDSLPDLPKTVSSNEAETENWKGWNPWR